MQEIKMKNMKSIRLALMSASVIVLTACGLFKGGNDENDVPDGGFNLFTIQQDKELGAQVEGEIASDPAQFPILDSASNKAAYKYIYDIRDKILATGKVKYAHDFKWQIRIINDNETLNAFCTPGGYIYVYTGIILFLENEAELAGVMGHEMAHADLRHSTRQMTKTFGVQLLMNAVLGDSSAVGQITTALVSLKFSREHETEADRMSVEYLCGTTYPADGAAGFFEKIEAMGQGTPPEFLSTHPSPENRIENFHNWAEQSGCPGKELYVQRYKNFQKLFQ